MAFAALNALVLTLTDEKATLEYQRLIYDLRRETLAFEKSELSTQYTNQMQLKFITEQDQDATTDDSVDEQNWERFLAEYTAAQDKLDAQDKILELARSNIDTKIEAISTSLESAEKQLSKNVENDMKTNK